MQTPGAVGDGVPVAWQLAVTFLTAGGLGALATWANGRAQQHRERTRDAASQSNADFAAVNAAARETVLMLEQDNKRLRIRAQAEEARADERDAAFERLMGEHRTLIRQSEACVRDLARACGLLEQHGVPFTSDGR